MRMPPITEGDSIDESVDEELYACLNPSMPVSFFLFAGAGSGKTRSLVKALIRVRDQYGRRLRLSGQRIGVITYTNAACDEIKHRLEFDSLIEVSTIHSFAWSLVGGFHADIREWLRENLASEVGELEEAQRKGRAGTKAAFDREKRIEDKKLRIAFLDEIKRFSYSPTGDNQGRAALNHSEVIAITASFLTEKPTLSRILVNKYPILLIDESQDTNKHLMDALMAVQAQHSSRFCLGLFGDTMQRIYADGKADLPEALPATWARPAKQMNHRCPARVVQLINKIRSAVDEQQQRSRTDKADGIVRLFIVPTNTGDKFRIEATIADRMVNITGDRLWSPADGNFKSLTLEHHMAARRMGFLDLFQPLYEIEKLRTGLLDGSLPGLRFFTHDIVPLVEAKKNKDEHAAARIVRKRSPLLDKTFLKAAGVDQPNILRKAREATNALMALWENGAAPNLLEILRYVSASGLFEVPEALRTIAARIPSDPVDQHDNAAPPRESVETLDDVTEAWERCLAVPYQQVLSYSKYLTGQGPFSTHQGVKGLEFPRVMVIMDDDEARGFLFSYEKLFGAKEKSEADIKNERSGNETSIDRTRRLFYVTCSRAENSLAIVAYSNDPNKVKDHAVAEGWFESDEVEIIESDEVEAYEATEVEIAE